MALTYELWNIASGNRVGEFDSRDEALASIQRTMLQHGTSMVDMLALGYEDEAGEGEVIARGADLVALVQSRATRSVMTTYKPFGDLDFSKLLVGPSIADLVKGPSIADLIGPGIVDAFIPRLSLPITSIPQLDIEQWVLPPTISGGLLSFGRIELREYFAQHNDYLTQMMTQTARLSFTSAALPAMKALTELASEVVRRAATDEKINDQIVALEQHPNARFVYHEGDYENYVGAVARDEERGHIVFIAAWRASKGRLTG